VSDIQRARILAATVEVSMTRGAGNVTVAHIVARAGVSRRTFYELFSDCEDCFLGAFEEGLGRAARGVRGAWDPNAKWVDRIRAALVALLSFFDSDRATAHLLIVGSLGAGPGALERRREALARIVSAIDEGRAESKLGDQLPPLTAEGVVGGVLSVLHARLLTSPSASDRGGGAAEDDSLLGLTGPLLGMIVLPFLGQAAARRENARPIPTSQLSSDRHSGNPLGRLEMRLTYRTVRVLMAIAAHPGSSNRILADAAEVTDQGQMSKLLARLHDIGLIENAGGGAARGEPNAWTLTDKGWRVQGAMAEQA
jgi:AcrR family transcriptional regulator